MPRSVHTRLRALPAALLVLVLVVAACTDEDSAGRPSGTVPTTIAPLAELSAEADTSPTIPMPPGYVVADTRGVPLLGLPEVPGADQPPLEVLGGDASIAGRVLLPDGKAVEGAVVRLERFVGERGGYIDVVTDEDGIYQADDLYGGHYRVRAWQEPNLATVAPQTTFLDSDGALEIDLAVETFEGKRLSAAIVIPEATVGEATFLDALYVQEEVDEEGIVRGKPIPDVEVSVLPLEGIRIDSDNPATTNEEGLASFVVMCLTPATHTLAIFADGERYAYEVPECLPGTGEIPPPPTTAPPEAPTTTVPEADFPIGGAFTPPFVGPVPAGTYLAPSSSSGCETTYEVWTDGRWILKRTSGRTIRLTSPARSFRSVGFSVPCRFTRFA